MSDQIQISDLSVFLPNGLGPSAFGLTTPPPCPILLDISINLHPALIPLVARSDSMSSLGVNYSSVSKAVYAMLSDKTATFNRPEEVMEVAAEVVMGLECVESVYISVKLPKALLHAQEVVYSAEWNRGGAVRRKGCLIRNLKVACVVGLHPHERVERQRLEVDLGVRFGKGAGFEDWDHRSFHDLALSVGHHCSHPTS
jgi:dihydroneopterin aldolase/2-amino-4-hydroxy-6-hydroxymethyldihydropteridine diphosphokinase/dihydropteroate synthase